MRYKVGDVVQVKSDLVGGRTYYSRDFPGESLYCNPCMCKYAGKIFRVIDIDYSSPETYFLSTDEPQKWVWSSEMLIPANNSIKYYLYKRKEVQNDN